MPVQISTTQQIKDRIVAALEANLNQVTPLLLKAYNRVLAAVLAGVFTLSNKFGLWIFNQIFPQSADLTALRRIGEPLDVNFKDASQTELTAAETGVNGTLIPTGTQYVASNQIVFINQSDVTIAGGIATLTLIAASGGSGGNVLTGTTLNIVSPISGADGVATVTAIVTPGFDAETTEEYRTRVIERFKERPQGGSVNDYQIWAKEIAGVTRAFVGSSLPGQVEVYPLTGDEVGTRIPTAGVLTDVSDRINDPARKPFVATVLVLAMTELPVDVSISNLLPNTQQIRDDIEKNISDFMLTRQPKQFILETAPKDVISVELLTAVIVQSGATSATVEIEIFGVPTPFKQLLINELVFSNIISF